MKRSILTFLFLISFVLTTIAQCDTYIQMVLGVESCLFPRVVSTQQLLLPCSAPAAYYQLTEGEFAFINYTPSSCITICMSGTPVEITCVNTVTGLDDRQKEKNINIYPNPAFHTLTIDGLTNATIVEVYDVYGNILLSEKNGSRQLDVSKLCKGLYFVKLFSTDGCFVRKFEKKL